MKLFLRKMNVNIPIPQRYKRTFQAMTLGIAIIYMTLVLYQNVYGYDNLQNIQLPIDEAVSLQQQNQLKNSLEIIKLNNNQSSQQHPTKIQQKLQTTNNYNLKNNNNYKNYEHNFHELNHGAVTATPKPPTTELDDIFISVKTTKNYHSTRLALIIKTWFQLAKGQTWFFTDTDDNQYQEKTNGHMINTNCSMGHFRKALCCKMSVELDVFLDSGKKWFCHFDDDNYVNVPRLVRLLDDYSPSADWYLGKPSISSPLELYNDNKKPATDKKITFWFATGGAGFCISRALALKMLPIAGGGKFIQIGDRIRFPDDVTMGFIIEHILNIPLTVVDAFHSHLEPMEFLRPETFQDQVSFSYSRIKDQWNVVKIDGFDLKHDPKRFYSLHCHLFPYFSFCPR